MAIRRASGIGCYNADLPVSSWQRVMRLLNKDDARFTAETLAKSWYFSEEPGEQVDVPVQEATRVAVEQMDVPSQIATRVAIIDGMGWLASITRSGEAESLQQYREDLNEWMERERLSGFGCAFGDLRCVAFTDGEMGQALGWKVTKSGKCNIARTIREWLLRNGIIYRAIEGGKKVGNHRLASLYIWADLYWEADFGAVMWWVPEDEVSVEFGSQILKVRGNTIYVRTDFLNVEARLGVDKFEFVEEPGKDKLTVIVDKTDGLQEPDGDVQPETWDAVCIGGVASEMANRFWDEVEARRIKQERLDAEMQHQKQALDEKREQALGSSQIGGSAYESSARAYESGAYREKGEVQEPKQRRQTKASQCRSLRSVELSPQIQELVRTVEDTTGKKAGDFQQDEALRAVNKERGRTMFDSSISKDDWLAMDVLVRGRG